MGGEVTVTVQAQVWARVMAKVAVTVVVTVTVTVTITLMARAWGPEKKASASPRGKHPKTMDVRAHSWSCLL